MAHADHALAGIRCFFRLLGERRPSVALEPLLSPDFTWLGPDGRLERNAAGLCELAATSGGPLPVAWPTALAEGRWSAFPAGEDAWLLAGEAEAPDRSGMVRRLAATCLCLAPDDSPRVSHIHLSAVPPTGQNAPGTANAKHLLQTVTDNIPGGVHCCLNDDRLTVTYMSDGFLGLLGYTRAELAGRFQNSLVEMMYEPDRAPTLASIRAQLATSHTAEAEYRVLNSQGHIQWVLGKGSLLREGGRDLWYCVLLDTTALKNAQASLRHTENRYRSALQATNLYVFESELPDDSFRLLSPARKRLFRVVPARYSEAMEKAATLCHPEDTDRFLRLFSVPNLLAAAARGEETVSLECRLRGTDQRYVWYSLSLALMPEEGGPCRLIGCLNDIDERKRHESQMLLSAQTDGLTGLYNKTCTEGLIRDFLEKYPCEEHAFLLVDIDNFKAINDNLGHLFGDAVLADLAATIKSLFRSADILGRIGGDEFVVFLKHVGTGPALRDKAEELCEAFRRSYDTGTNEHSLSCSVGIALAPRDGVLYGDLYRKADAALYMAKNSGKNRYCIYDEAHIARHHALPPRNTVTAIAAASGSVLSFQENLLSYAFSMLYEARNIDTVVHLILGMVGDHYGVSRAYVFENSPDDLYCSNSYEWCAPGVEPQKDRLQNVVYADLGNFLSLYDTEGIFYCRDVDLLNGPGHDLVVSQGIRSMLHVAIFDEHRHKGFVGFDECQGLRLWTSDEINTLTLLAKIVGIFVLKRNISARLVNAYNDIRSILDSMAAWTYVIDQNSYELLYLNEATRRFVPGARLGQKCHEAFFKGRHTPCEHCPIRAMLERGELRATLEVENPSLGVWSEATASRIPWSGGNHAVLMCCTDITRYKLAECAPEC